MTVVSNTSPLSNLSAIGHIELLAQIYDRTTIPTAVANELASAAPEDLGVREVPNLATRSKSFRNSDCGNIGHSSGCQKSWVDFGLTTKY